MSSHGRSVAAGRIEVAEARQGERGRIGMNPTGMGRSAKVGTGAGTAGSSGQLRRAYEATAALGWHVL